LLFGLGRSNSVPIGSNAATRWQIPTQIEQRMVFYASVELYCENVDQISVVCYFDSVAGIQSQFDILQLRVAKFLLRYDIKCH
jgi:hypothetical protein